MKNRLILIIAIILMINLASALTITSVNMPKEIQPGKNAEISFEIKNNLAEDVSDVEISLDLKDLPFAPYLSSSEISFDEIREDKTKTIYFQITALSNAESGTYKIPVEISYTKDNGRIEKTAFISLVVNSKPVLELDYEGNLIKGKNNELIIKIINSGLGNVKLLSMETENTIGLQILSSKFIYIGEIDSDDFDSSNFKVFVSENSPSIISLPVKLEYKDALNNDYSEEKTLSIRTYTQEQAIQLGLVQKSNVPTIIISVVVLVVLYLIYRFIRKRLKKRKQQEAV